MLSCTTHDNNFRITIADRAIERRVQGFQHRPTLSVKVSWPIERDGRDAVFCLIQNFVAHAYHLVNVAVVVNTE
ncbi:MAG: hypothetical protein ACI915_004881 [Gammaproteobacteria bacterium]|jgi:hypothetical protein